MKGMERMKGMKRMKGILLLLFSLSSLHLFSADYTSSSVLSTGKWVQLKVSENAVYKLTYDDIKKMGFNDPSKIKIYGYGGWILEQNFTKSYIDDLPEVSVWMNKGSDNAFNAGDYLLFYGRGTIKWSYNSSSDFFEHENNPYSTYGSYFITENEQGPKEMTVQNSYSGTADEVTTFDDYLLHEKELKAIINSGRELFGENFAGSPVQNFTFSIPGIVNEPGKVCLSFAASPPETKTVFLSIGDEQILSLNLMKPGDYKRADLATGIKPWLGEKSENVTVKVSYSSTGTSYLNYINLNVKRQLRTYNNAYTFFRDKTSRNSALKYTIDNASSGCLVFDITDNQNVRLVQTSLNGSKLSFGADTKKGAVSEYVLVDVSKSFPVPEMTKEIKNQNLHALPQTEMVILVPEVYAALAEKLAEKHRSLQGLHVTVVQPEPIYNEFSSGVPDATAYRRFMKMFYDRAKNENEKPKYLLLYGDGLADNRHLAAPSLDLKYYLLTYQVKESVNENNSYGTDDYFGFLDDNEGLSLGDDVLDLGIGRFPVSSYEQAENILNKVIAYMDNTNYGKWKNTVIFTADDTGDDSFCTHAKEADQLAVYMQNNHPEYLVKKSYMDAYKSQNVNGKKTYPDAKGKLLTTLKEGCFLVNYTGHGSTKGISAEDMLHITDVYKMNFESLPLWITATCDFGWFDSVETSAGEEIFLNKKSAGIALFTTTRVVNSYGNFRLNDRLIRNIFSKKDGKYLCLGDILRKSKNEVGRDTNKLNYVLLGDPALKLNYPETRVQLQSINGKAIEEEIFNFPALEKMTLEGQIIDETGALIDGFNGDLYTTIYDAEQTIQSMNTTIVKDKNKNDSIIHWEYTDYPNIVYTGNSKVENGHFSLSFYVPQDISYTKESGKINFYASDESKHTDSFGSFQNCTFYGTSSNYESTDKGPEIVTMFLNSQSFKDGGNVNETPFFYAEVFDEMGINVSGNSSGHDVTISIDNNPPRRQHVLNEYYRSENEQKGNIGFSIPALPAGEHELVFKVWNILNNSTTASLRFNVVEGLKPEIYSLSARPNPAKEKTTFQLDYDRPEVPVEVEIRVYDLTGRLIWLQSESGASSYAKSYSVEWNLINNTGGKVSSGVYVYQAFIKTSKGSEATKSKKIIVL
jgi:hypothetical protein